MSDNNQTTEEQLSSVDKERVEAACQEGPTTFSAADIDTILEKSEVVREKSKHLKDFIDYVKLFWELLKDYKDKRYTAVPWRFIAAVGFALLYLINPFDIIPDFIPVFGYLDDAAVISFVIGTFKAELDDYQAWKENN